MPLDFTFRLNLMMLLVKIIVKLLGLISVKNKDDII